MFKKNVFMSIHLCSHQSQSVHIYLFQSFHITSILDNVHLLFPISVSLFLSIYMYIYAYLSIYISSDDYNVVLGNAFSKRRQLVIEGHDVCSIAGIDGTAARDDCYAGVPIK